MKKIYLHITVRPDVYAVYYKISRTMCINLSFTGACKLYIIK